LAERNHQELLYSARNYPEPAMPLRKAKSKIKIAEFLNFTFCILIFDFLICNAKKVGPIPKKAKKPKLKTKNY